ncbi:MAG: S-methyl-5'-thioadenosine phosphorylase [Deltaproteobacteria bacterium]|nr:S-methyl-5'-thioadenosine phosphorylase [Deltaproteobacteria bacterium]
MSSYAKAKIGVIGGSGLYEMEGLKVLEEQWVETPFGRPSDQIVIGELEGEKLAFLPRHGKGHRFNPTEINFRANIFAMKLLGVESILAVSAVGSMKEEIEPGHIVLVNQFIDRTRQRPSTFFEKGIVAHVSFADPVCPRLFEAVYRGTKETKATVHKGGTYVCIEGPMFSTRAESKVYRSWGVDVIGMTNYQEAKLAREAEICYTTIALSTDYDCWKEDETVTGEQVMATMKKNVATAKEIIRKSIPHVAGKRNCSCGEALKGAIFTDPSRIETETKKRLAPLVEKYL